MQGNVNIPDSTITTNLSFRQLVLMNMRALTNFPYIEKDFDALTDYELLCLVVKFLNDVIANQNEQNDSITRMYESFLALQTYVNNTKDTLEDAFNNLDDYVRNYFDNLDVQEEINNKLDQMLEDGVLEQIIEQFLQSTAIWSFDTVADMKLATNLINGSYAKTLGYHTKNDGGMATYKIRTKTNDDVVNEMNIIAISDTLVAEIIPTTNVNPEMYGAYGDGTHDDTTVISYILNSIDNPIVSLTNRVYLCTSTITLEKRKNINFNLSTIKFTNTGDGLVINMTSEDTMSHKRFAPVIENIIFDGENTSRVVYIDYAYKGIIKNIYINNFKNIGMEKNRGYEMVIDNIWFWASNQNTTSIGLYVSGNDSEFGNIFGMNCHTGVKLSGGGNHFKQIHMWLFNDTQGEGMLDGNALYEGSAMIEIAGSDRYFIDYAYFDSYQYGIKYTGYGQVYINSGLMYCPDLSNFASNYLESTIYLIYTDTASIDYLWRISISNLSYIVPSGNTVTAKVIPDNYTKRPIRFTNCIIPYAYDNRQKDYIDRFTLQNCTNISLQATPIGEGKLRIHGVVQKDDTTNSFRIPYPSSEYVPEKVNEIVPCVTSASQYGTNPSLNMINIGSVNITGLDAPIANNYYFIDVIINVLYT